MAPKFPNNSNRKPSPSTPHPGLLETVAPGKLRSQSYCSLLLSQVATTGQGLYTHLCGPILEVDVLVRVILIDWKIISTLGALELNPGPL